MSIFNYISKKCEILFKNLLLNLPFFIFCKKKFFENLVSLTDTVADLAVRYTLCGRYTLCAHCTRWLGGSTGRKNCWITVNIQALIDGACPVSITGRENCRGWNIQALIAGEQVVQGGKIAGFNIWALIDGVPVVQCRKLTGQLFILALGDGARVFLCRENCRENCLSWHF